MRNVEQRPARSNSRSTHRVGEHKVSPCGRDWWAVSRTVRPAASMNVTSVRITRSTIGSARAAARSGAEYASTSPLTAIVVASIDRAPKGGDSSRGHRTGRGRRLRHSLRAAGASRALPPCLLRKGLAEGRVVVEAELGVEGVVVGLVDEVGFAGALVPQRGQQPGQALADVGEVGAVIVGLGQFGADRGDRLAEMCVLRS